MSIATSENTVAVSSCSSACMNCGHGYFGERHCEGCETGLLYAASTKIGQEELYKAFAEQSGLEFAGYTSGFPSTEIYPEAPA